MEWLETPAICNQTQHDLAWVKHATWQLRISFWLAVKYIFLRTSHFFSLSSSYPILHQQIMATQTPQPGKNGTEPGGSTGVTTNISLSGTQREYRHQLVQRNAANVATKNMTQDAHFKIVRKTGSSKNRQQYTIGCDYIHITVNDGQLTI